MGFSLELLGIPGPWWVSGWVGGWGWWVGLLPSLELARVGGCPFPWALEGPLPWAPWAPLQIRKKDRDVQVVGLNGEKRTWGWQPDWDF
jgi:hypothetical protein